MSSLATAIEPMLAISIRVLRNLTTSEDLACASLKQKKPPLATDADRF
jgi:hypothetical protein